MKALCLLIALVVPGRPLAQESAKADSKRQLMNVLQQLQRAPTPQSDSQKPGWLDPIVQVELKEIVQAFPGTEEAATAQVWLSVCELEASQSRPFSQRKQKALAEIAVLDGIIKRDPAAWQAKMAHLAKAGSYLTARDYESLSAHVKAVLPTIATYRSETNEQFQAYLTGVGSTADDVEPLLMRMLVIGACEVGKPEQALKYAKDLQTRFPAWAIRNHIASDIEQLELGGLPYRSRK